MDQWAKGRAEEEMVEQLVKQAVLVSDWIKCLPPQSEAQDQIYIQTLRVQIMGVRMFPPQFPQQSRPHSPHEEALPCLVE
jgi:hypothetical protein